MRIYKANRESSSSESFFALGLNAKVSRVHMITNSSPKEKKEETAAKQKENGRTQLLRRAWRLNFIESALRVLTRESISFVQRCKVETLERSLCAMIREFVSTKRSTLDLIQVLLKNISDENARLDVFFRLVLAHSTYQKHMKEMLSPGEASSKSDPSSTDKTSSKVLMLRLKLFKALKKELGLECLVEEDITDVLNSRKFIKEEDFASFLDSIKKKMKKKNITMTKTQCDFEKTFKHMISVDQTRLVEIYVAPFLSQDSSLYITRRDAKSIDSKKVASLLRDLICLRAAKKNDDVKMKKKSNVHKEKEEMNTIITYVHT